MNKINNIKAAISGGTAIDNVDPTIDDVLFDGAPLAVLPTPSIDEVAKLINSLPAKSSPMDSIPTSVIKSCVDVFAPLIARLAALSFSDGMFPTRYKVAAVTPLLKKKGLDSDNPANFRPISNLHTISKIVERLFLSRIIAHVEQAACFNRRQSAYRKGHSTETTLLKLANDIYCTADNKARTLLVQLDLSAAFDTIDIDTLLKRLERSFGLSGAVLSWIRSYISGRSQFVRYGDSRSEPTNCKYGVPQGSVLGPLLFSLYIAPIASVIDSFGVDHSQYADDTQLYIALNRDGSTSTMEGCFSAVHRWFTANGLSLNPDKSEAIIIGTGARQRVEEEIDSVPLGDVDIEVAGHVRSLGVEIDSTMSFDRHVSNICKSAHCHIRALRRIRNLISTADAKAISTALVSSRLDYCNSLLYGITASNICKLQRVQNVLARLVHSSGTRLPTNQILADLHWLPVNARINYKIALLTYKVLTTGRPTYLRNIVNMHEPARLLRSSAHHLLHDRAARTAFGSRAFCHAAPAVWNKLPYSLTDNVNDLSLSAFKRQLKTHFFTTSFNR